MRDRTMNKHTIRGEHRGQAPHGEIYRILGIKGNRLPDAGVEVQYIRGVPVWVEPKADQKHFIRTRCLCPSCFREMALSRLQQHRCGGSHETQT